jgi:hypothetical protein
MPASDSAIFAMPCLPAPGRVAKRLLIAGVCMTAVAIAIIVVDVNDAVRAGDHKLALGHDLLPSYVAGTFVREGRARAMYDLDAVHAEEARIVQAADLQIEGRGGPWLNPPFFAWLFAPLSALPYRAAAAVFLTCNLLLLAGSVRLLCRLLPVRGWRVALVPLLMCTSMPFWQALCHQQNTFISLLLISLTVTFWLGDKPLAAGCAAGLLFFKPQLAVAVAAVLVATAGRRALLGLLLTTVSLFAITILTLPGTLADYLTKLGPILHALQFDPRYNWGRQNTFQSFWRLLCDGHVGGATQALPRLLTWLSSGAVAALLAAATWKHLRSPAPSAGSRRRLIAAAVASMPLMMPYYLDYDLLLLTVPAVLFACDWLQRDSYRSPLAARWQLGLWIALFFETQINPGLAGQTRFNLSVPIMAALWGVTVWHCLANAATEENSSRPVRDNQTALAA